MTVKEYLAHLSNKDITNTLIYLDYWLKYLHSNNCFVVGNVGDITILENNMLKADKYDYLDSGYDSQGDIHDIQELCYVGICAFNHFKYVDYGFTREFIKNINDNLDLYINNGKIPHVMREYYIEVIERGNVIYLNDYLTKIGYFDKENDVDNGRTRGKTKVKTTPAGIAFGKHDDEGAFVNALLLPSIITLVYLILLVGYFVFFG